MLVSIPPVSVWGWRADGFSTLAVAGRICLPSLYREAQGVSVSILLGYLMQCPSVGGDEKQGVIWCNW